MGPVYCGALYMKHDMLTAIVLNWCAPSDTLGEGGVTISLTLHLSYFSCFFRCMPMLRYLSFLLPSFSLFSLFFANTLSNALLPNDLIALFHNYDILP